MAERPCSGLRNTCSRRDYSVRHLRDGTRESPRRPRLSVVILNLNRSKDTISCAEYVFRSTFQDLEVLVIDNGSSAEDKMDLELGLHTPGELIDIRDNIGVAAAWNLGIRHVRKKSQPEFIFLLNNDTVIETTVIEELVSAAGRYTEGAAFGPTIADERYSHDTDSGIAQTQSHPIVDFNLSGSALMIRAVLFDKIGMFDEDYFVYGEEADLMERMRHTSWKPLRIVTKGKVHHIGSQTAAMITGFEAYHRSRNSLMFAGKNLRGRRFLMFIIDYIMRYQVWGFARDLRTEKPSRTLLSRMRGVIDGTVLLLHFATTPKDS